MIDIEALGLWRRATTGGAGDNFNNKKSVARGKGNRIAWLNVKAGFADPLRYL